MHSLRIAAAMPRLLRSSLVKTTCLLSAMLAAASSVGTARAQAVPELIDRVRVFAEKYQRDAPSLVVEERYRQTVTLRRDLDARGSYGPNQLVRPQAAAPQHREMTSELVMVRLPASVGWVMLRDVLIVDNRRLRDNQERLLKLLQSPQPDAFARAAEVARESARFNLGRVERTINVPDVAIEYLLPRHAARMQVEPPRRGTIDGIAVEMIRFREVRGPSIIRTPDGADLLAEGRVWVEPASGEIVRAELIVRDRLSTGTNVVDFRVDPRLMMRVPVKMTERYETRAELIEAVATYSNVRSFAVATTEKVAKPPR
jgi:hypothetical protein